MADKRDLILNLLGRETVSPAAKKAARALDDLGDEATQAGRKFEKLDRQVSDTEESTAKLAAGTKLGEHALEALGDEADGAKHDLEQLDRQILVTKATVAVLGREIARTGDLDLFRNLGRQQSTLRKLEGLKKSLADAGESAATRFGLRFSQRLGSLLEKAPISPYLIGAAALAAPAVSAALAGAVTAGVGVGIVGIGAVIAAFDSRVKAAGKRLGSVLASGFKQDASVFVAPLLDGIGKAEAKFNELRPVIRDLFSASAKFATPLFEGLLRGADDAIRDLRDVVHNAQPAVSVFADEIPQAIDATTEALKILSEDADFNAKALKVLFDVIEGSILGFANTVQFLSKIFKQSLGGILVDKLNKIKPASDDATGGLKDLAGQAPKTADRLGDVEQEAKDTRTALEKLGDAFDDLLGQFLGVDEAQLRARQGMADLRTELGKGKKSLDLSSQAGRDHRDALLQQVEKLNDVRTAMIKAKVPTDEANRKFGDQVQALEDAAVAAGYDRDEVHKLLKKYRELPKTVTTKIDAETRKALIELKSVRAYLAKIKNKTVQVTAQVYYTSSGNLHVPGGTFIKDRWGGITEHAQQGLLRQAQIFSPRSPARYAFAEPATGGEAFIPRRGNTALSRAITERAAAWNGGVVNWGGGGPMSITVMAAPGRSSTDRALGELFMSLLNRGGLQLVVASGGKVRVAGR